MDSTARVTRRGTELRERPRRVVAAAFACAAAVACTPGRAHLPEIDTTTPDPLVLQYTGTAEVEGDFATRNERRTVVTELRAIATGAGSMRIDESTWLDGGDAPPVV